MDRNEIKVRYLKAEGDYKRKKQGEEKILFYLAAGRFVTFIGGIALSWIGFLHGQLTGLLILAIFITLFLFLLKLWSDHTRKMKLYRNLERINRAEAAALEGIIHHFNAGTKYSDLSHDFSADLDLFGESSLFQHLNRTVTGYGSDILADWLTNPFPLSSSLELRQAAIRELAAKETFRHRFMAGGMNASLAREDIASLLDWMQGKENLINRLYIKFLIWSFPVVTLAALILAVAGVVHYSVFSMMLLINFMILALGIRKINRIHNSVSGKYLFLSSFSEILRVLENETFESEEMVMIKRSISSHAASASLSVKKLNIILQAFDTRLNFIAGVLLNGLLLWDYHTIARLEKWKSEYRTLLPGWLSLIGKTDAYISLGNFAANNPGFVFPSISDDNTIISASGLGHPLIDDSKRVCNDFVIGENGICIITGANMAGKSTFLRTIAINFILAMTGAKVCAANMRFTPMKPFTSMRTADSLALNESYFYAELKRLRLLKERLQLGEKIFFLLDEILKGTNSTDKSTGSRLFLARLAVLGATGIIATHDISLGDLEKEYPATIMNRCFEIEMKGEEIFFDYRLRNGITTKMNATYLMNQMGLLS